MLAAPALDVVGGAWHGPTLAGALHTGAAPARCSAASAYFSAALWVTLLCFTAWALTLTLPAGLALDSALGSLPGLSLLAALAWGGGRLGVGLGFCSLACLVACACGAVWRHGA